MPSLASLFQISLLFLLSSSSLLVTALSYENLKLSSPESTYVPKILVYTYTDDGYRHDSIPTAIGILAAGEQRWGVEFDFTEDRSRFTDDGLKPYDALMFISTTGTALDDKGLKAFQRYLQCGGNFIGVHGATVALPGSDVYKQSIGALFEWHPVQQDATFVTKKHDHPSTKNVPDQWRFSEEVYYFTSDPRDVGATILVTVDETSYNNESYISSNGNPHPIAWYIDPPKTSQPLADGVYKAGRTFYTALGHSNETWQNETFIDHVLGGVFWALDGASTQAYNVGKVGSNSTPRPPAPSSTSWPTSSPASNSGSFTDINGGTPTAAVSGKVLQAHSAAAREVRAALGRTVMVLSILAGVAFGSFVIL